VQIFDPIKCLEMDVRVIEDTGTGVNFISPAIARDCNLKIRRTKPIIHEGITGERFTATELVEATWFGRDKIQDTGIFYLAPKATPIELLVGNDFLTKYPDVFMSSKPINPAMLNVPKKMTVSEKR
jgi:hypothetical protein